MESGFQNQLDRFRAMIEEALRCWLFQILNEAPPALAEAMSYCLLAPGKRLRPILAMLACESAGGRADQALAAGCALEMVHTYSLIHDDLPAMDDDDLRRGMPTCHRKYGEALAILAGDALLSGAFQVLTEGYPPRTASVSVLELARGSGAIGMVAGQVLDLSAEGKIVTGSSPKNLEDLIAIHRRKTGALFGSSVRLGLYAAQGEREIDPGLQDALDKYSLAFGLAFQVADDLLDVRGSSDRTGKRVGKDAARGKLTFPGLLGVEASQSRLEVLHQDALAALVPLGKKADGLRMLTTLVAKRDC